MKAIGRLALVMVMVALMSGVALAGGGGETLEVSIDLPRNGSGVVGQKAVPEGMIGKTCSVEGVTNNGRSVHPGNNLVISSGGSSFTVEDFEMEPFQAEPISGELTLGAEIVVELVLGDDGITSSVIHFTVTCPPDETTTTTEPTTTTSEATTTTMATTTSSDASTLPFTGQEDSGSLAALGALAILAGGTLLVLMRRGRIEDL